MPKANTTIISGARPSAAVSASLPRDVAGHDAAGASDPAGLSKGPGVSGPASNGAADQSRNPGTVSTIPPKAGSRGESRVTVRPGRHRDVGTAWLVVLGLMLLAGLPLSIELMRPAVFDPAERIAIDIAVETWERNAAFTDPEHLLDPWTPVYQGEARPDLPPAATWLHVIALRRSMEAGMDPSAQAMVWSRIIAAAMALLLIGSVFWCGHSLGGMPTAAMAGFAALSMPVLMFFGRLGTADIHVAAWVALAVAGALWAMRPMRRSPGLARQLIGWLICGVALGMGTLTAGPTAVPPIVLPLAVMSMLCPRRLGHTLGVIAAIAVAVLIVTPWSIHVHESMPNGWEQWLVALAPEGMRGNWSAYGSSVGWRASVGLAVLGLWALWVIPGLFQPFSTSTGEARRPMLLGWAWFVTTAVLMLLAPGPASVRPLLLLIAPAALMIGQVMRQYHDLCAEGRHARLWRTGRLLTLIITGVGSITLPALAYFETGLPDWATQWLGTDATLLMPMHAGYYLGSGVALVLIALLAGRFAIANHPGRALAGWSVWVLVLACLFMVPMTRGELMQLPAAVAQLAWW